MRGYYIHSPLQVTRTMSEPLRPHGTRRGLAAGTAGRPAQNAPEEAGELAGRPKERRCPMDSGTSQSYQRAPNPARGCPGAPAWTGAYQGRQAASCWGLRTSPGSNTGDAVEGAAPGARRGRVGDLLQGEVGW